MIARINPLTNTIEGKDNFSRNLYVLVAVRSPDHHGLFVGDLAGGDGVDLLDVLDLGNGLHGCVFMCVIKVRKRLACPSLKSCGRGSVSRKNFQKGHAFFFFCLLLVFFFTSTSEVALREKRGKRGRRKKRERMNFFLKALLNAKVILVCSMAIPRAEMPETNTQHRTNIHTKKKEKRGQKEKEGE